MLYVMNKRVKNAIQVRSVQRDITQRQFVGILASYSRERLNVIGELLGIDVRGAPNKAIAIGMIVVTMLEWKETRITDEQGDLWTLRKAIREIRRTFG